MPKEVEVSVTETPEDSPSSPVIVSQPNPQAEQVIQAAIQTGEAVQSAREAAAEAKEVLAESQAQTRPMELALSQIRERLDLLTNRVEELTIQDDADDMEEIASANVAEIEEPEPSQPTEPETVQDRQPEPAHGGFLKRLFLNQ